MANFIYTSQYTDKIIPTPKIWKDKNGNPTRFGWIPDVVVLHIMQGSITSCDNYFSNPNGSGSAHYGISKTGEVHQYADEKDAPWANGLIKNPTAEIVKERQSTNPNFYTISIEHEGLTGEVWTNNMFDKSVKLTADICIRWKIPVDRKHILGHYEIDSVNKINCPGTGLTSMWNEYITRVKAIVDKANTPIQPPQQEPKPLPQPDMFYVIEMDPIKETYVNQFYSGTSLEEANILFAKYLPNIKSPNLLTIYKNSKLIKVEEGKDINPAPIDNQHENTNKEDIFSKIIKFLKSIFKI